MGLVFFDDRVFRRVVGPCPIDDIVVGSLFGHRCAVDESLDSGLLYEIIDLSSKLQEGHFSCKRVGQEIGEYHVNPTHFLIGNIKLILIPVSSTSLAVLYA